MHPESARSLKSSITQGKPGIHILLIFCIQIIFWICAARYIQLPGLYMDAANPDYFAAQTLNPGLRNVGLSLPQALPILSVPHHGMQNYYVALPFLSFFGTSIVTVRIAHALFGAVIAVLFYILSVKFTKNCLTSFLCTILLVSDIAFISSFRTQYYSVISGSVWLFAAFICIFNNFDLNGLSKKRIILSGIFYGLSIYSYFVFIFFLPAFILLFIFSNGIKINKAILRWFAGLCIGMLTYLFGFISFIIATGDLGKAVDALKAMNRTLHPLSSSLTILQTIVNAFKLSWGALINSGNEDMIFQESISPELVKVKAGVIFMAMCIGLSVLFFNKIKNKYSMAKTISIFPFIYILAASAFGDRLGIHHYSPLVPVFYLTATVIFAGNINLPECRETFARIFKKSAFILWCIIFIFNFYQQQTFYNKLDLTGGVKFFSNATTLMIDEALSTPYPTSYYFPEWGFYMPFVLLTSNKIPVLVAGWSNKNFRTHYLQKDSASNREIRVVFWDINNKNKYIEDLTESEKGEANAPRFKTFYQRDWKPAFYMLTVPRKHPSP
jgi:hypothetical protein